MKRILICEDEPDAQSALKEICAKRGYEIFTAADGQEAIAQAQKTQPDVIIMDIRMPKIDGIEAARKIREFNTKSKIVFITAFQSPQLQKEASKLNIATYLVKPASADEILTAVSDSLKD